MFVEVSAPLDYHLLLRNKDHQGVRQSWVKLFDTGQLQYLEKFTLVRNM